jgi:glutamine synthetase
MLQRTIWASGGPGESHMNVHRSALSEEAGAARLDAAEADAFLNDNPEVKYVDCIFVDLCGNVRGKRIARGELESAFREGLAIPYTIYFLDARGEIVEPLTRAASAGGATGTAWPVPGTLTRVSWAQKPHGQVLMSLRDASDAPYFGEPRNVLKRVLRRFEGIDAVPVVGAQIQFQLVERDRTKNALALPSTALDATEVEALRNTILDAAAVQGLPGLRVSKAASPLQFDVELSAPTDALKAADHLVFARQVVRAVARRHQRDATFMAKPFLDTAASGMRFEIDMRRAGEDTTADGGDLIRSAVGGVQTLMAELMALAVPNPNAFRRFSGADALPRNRRWGYLNASANISIIPGAGDAPLVALRMAGADANPYLVIAAYLAAVHHGVSRHLEPTQPAEGDVSGFVDPTLPMSLDAALLALENGSILREYLDPAYVDLYCATKRAELERFRNVIPAHEYDWYA